MVDCIKILLTYGNCDINEKEGWDRDGETPLSLTVYYKFEGAVRYLLKHGADTAVRYLCFYPTHRFILIFAILKQHDAAFIQHKEVQTTIQFGNWDCPGHARPTDGGFDRAVTIKKLQEANGILIKLDWRYALRKSCEYNHRVQIFVFLCL